MPAGLRLTPAYGAADAEAVLRRKLPGARCRSQIVHHPFWWVRLAVTPAAGRRAGRTEDLEVLVDARTGKGFIAGFVPRGVDLGEADYRTYFTSGTVTGEDAEVTARKLVATHARRRFKLGMGLDFRMTAGARPVIKPNWLVSGVGEKHSARFLVDGLDGSHWVIDAVPTGN